MKETKKFNPTDIESWIVVYPDAKPSAEIASGKVRIIPARESDDAPFSSWQQIFADEIGGPLITKLRSDFDGRTINLGPQDFKASLKHKIR